MSSEVALNPPARTDPERFGLRTAVLVAAYIVGLLGITGCSPATYRPSEITSTSGAPSTTAAATPPSPSAVHPTASPGRPGALDISTVSKVLVVVEENRSVADVTANMPYLTGLAARYAQAVDYHAVRHPSLPNYLVIAGGSTFGVTDDADPASHPLRGPSVFGSLLTAGRTAKTYAEASPTPCAQRNAGRYAVRHNPWTYFTDPAERAACERYDVPAGTPTQGPFADDVRRGSLPDFGLLIPDVCNDGHDCSAQRADRWLSDWLPSVESGPDFTSGRLLVVVTWDEDDGSDGNRVQTVFLHPSLQGKAIRTKLGHYDLSHAILALHGLPALRDAADASQLLPALAGG